MNSVQGATMSNLLIYCCNDILRQALYL